MLILIQLQVAVGGVLLLVIGTPRQVHPFAALIDLGRGARVLINRERVGEALPSTLTDGGDGFDFSENATVARDVFLPGDADDTVAALVKELGWELE